MTAPDNHDGNGHDGHGHEPGEYSHFHLDIPSILKHIEEGTKKITPEEDKAIESDQHPDAFLICCIDSRIQPDKALDYGPGVTLEYRPISAVVPPVKDADAAFLGRMAFRRLKDIRNIVVMAHSDCGGAQASISVPDPDLKSGNDLDIVAAETHRCGLDVSTLSKEFLKAANGDKREAGNSLAKAVAVQSMKNLLEYKGRAGFATIGDEVKAGECNVVVLYYDLKDLHFERFRNGTQSWERIELPKDPAPDTPKPATKFPGGPAS